MRLPSPPPLSSPSAASSAHLVPDALFSIPDDTVLRAALPLRPFHSASYHHDPFFPFGWNEDGPGGNTAVAVANVTTPLDWVLHADDGGPAQASSSSALVQGSAAGERRTEGERGQGKGQRPTLSLSMPSHTAFHHNHDRPSQTATESRARSRQTTLTPPHHTASQHAYNSNSHQHSPPPLPLLLPPPTCSPLVVDPAALHRFDEGSKRDRTTNERSERDRTHDRHRVKSEKGAEGSICLSERTVSELVRLGSVAVERAMASPRKRKTSEARGKGKGKGRGKEEKERLEAENKEKESLEVEEKEDVKVPEEEKNEAGEERGKEPRKETEDMVATKRKGGKGKEEDDDDDDVLDGGEGAEGQLDDENQPISQGEDDKGGKEVVEERDDAAKDETEEAAPLQKDEDEDMPPARMDKGKGKSKVKKKVRILSPHSSGSDLKDSSSKGKGKAKEKAEADDNADDDSPSKAANDNPSTDDESTTTGEFYDAMRIRHPIRSLADAVGRSVGPSTGLNEDGEPPEEAMSRVRARIDHQLRRRALRRAWETPASKMQAAVSRGVIKCTGFSGIAGMGNRTMMNVLEGDDGGYDDWKSEPELDDAMDVGDDRRSPTPPPERPDTPPHDPSPPAPAPSGEEVGASPSTPTSSPGEAFPSTPTSSSGERTRRPQPHIDPKRRLRRRTQEDFDRALMPPPNYFLTPPVVGPAASPSGSPPTGPPRIHIPFDRHQRAIQEQTVPREAGTGATSASVLDSGSRFRSGSAPLSLSSSARSASTHSAVPTASVRRPAARRSGSFTDSETSSAAPDPGSGSGSGSSAVARSGSRSGTPSAPSASTSTSNARPRRRGVGRDLMALANGVFGGLRVTRKAMFDALSSERTRRERLEREEEEARQAEEARAREEEAREIEQMIRAREEERAREDEVREREEAWARQEAEYDTSSDFGIVRTESRRQPREVTSSLSPPVLSNCESSRDQLGSRLGRGEITRAHATNSDTRITNTGTGTRIANTGNGTTASPPRRVLRRESASRARTSLDSEARNSAEYHSATAAAALALAAASTAVDAAEAAVSRLPSSEECDELRAMLLRLQESYYGPDLDTDDDTPSSSPPASSALPPVRPPETSFYGAENADGLADAPPKLSGDAPPELSGDVPNGDQPYGSTIVQRWWGGTQRMYTTTPDIRSAVNGVGSDIRVSTRALRRDRAFYGVEDLHDDDDADTATLVDEMRPVEEAAAAARAAAARRAADRAADRAAALAGQDQRGCEQRKRQRADREREAEAETKPARTSSAAPRRGRRHLAGSDSDSDSDANEGATGTADTRPRKRRRMSQIEDSDDDDAVVAEEEGRREGIPARAPAGAAGTRPGGRYLASRTSTTSSEAGERGRKRSREVQREASDESAAGDSDEVEGAKEHKKRRTAGTMSSAHVQLEPDLEPVAEAEADQSASAPLSSVASGGAEGDDEMEEDEVDEGEVEVEYYFSD